MTEQHFEQTVDGKDVYWLETTIPSPKVEVTIKIENVYPDDTITETKTVVVDRPPTMDEDAEEYDDWAHDNLFPHTGTGREDGDAGYFVEVLVCPQLAALVGRKFEWGT